MKRILSALLIVSMLTGMLAVSASAEDIPMSGKCGENVTWSLSGVNLTISGSGPMYDYSYADPVPWSKSTTWLSRVVIEEGVTSIGEFAFGMMPVDDIQIAASVQYIGNRAFHGSKCNLYFMGEAPQTAENAFEYALLKNVYAVNWSQEEKDRLGAPIPISEAFIGFDVLNSKQLVGLNDVFEPEDFVLKMYYRAEGGFSVSYTPRQMEFFSYDNSTYVEKKLRFSADGHTFEMTYFVTDGANHLDLINVEFGEIPSYYYETREMAMTPVVTMGSMELVYRDHYELTTDGVTVGTEGRVTVKGKGIADGFEKTFYFPVLKKDISAGRVSTDYLVFSGIPLENDVSITDLNGIYRENVDFQVFYENNINQGTATARVVGIGNCYGEATGNYYVTRRRNDVKLLGNCIGSVGSELGDDIPVYEQHITPYELVGCVDCNGYNVAAYALYKVVGEQAELIEERVTDPGNIEETAFRYDFSAVYEDDVDEGGAVYLLSYSWVTEAQEVYAGVTVFYIPAKVPDATSMTMNHIANDGDFRKEYLSLSGDDGALGQITWTSSNPAVATVENGVVTLKKPGNTVIMGQYGDMIQTHEVTVSALDLTQGIIFDYSEQDGTARVIYDDRLLTEGTDYKLSVREKDGGYEVTATGCGLFTGELVKLFNGLDSLADPHTHGFDNSCDGSCNSCDFTRDNDHVFSEQWSKNETRHWHSCTACGEKTDIAQHTVSAADATICEICGPMYNPGDLNGDENVDEDDAIYLLQHILLPDFFPITQDADYTADNRLDEDDAIYLLQHVLLPDFFPL